MKKILLNFASNLLSKDQMKVIKGGDDPYSGGGFCLVSSSCRLYVRERQQTYTGECQWVMFGSCFCRVTVDGQSYVTDPNTNSMCLH